MGIQTLPWILPGQSTGDIFFPYKLKFRTISVSDSSCSVTIQKKKKKHLKFSLTVKIIIIAVFCYYTRVCRGGGGAGNNRHLISQILEHPFLVAVVGPDVSANEELAPGRRGVHAARRAQPLRPAQTVQTAKHD